MWTLLIASEDLAVVIAGIFSGIGHHDNTAVTKDRIGVYRLSGPRRALRCFS